MSDNTRTDFPTMGVEASQASAAADYSPNLKFRPRGGSSGGTAEAATAGHRTGHQERLGAKYAPQMSMVTANAPEASLEQRNVRLLPSSIGNRDFWAKRELGQVQQ